MVFEEWRLFEASISSWPYHTENLHSNLDATLLDSVHIYSHSVELLSWWRRTIVVLLLMLRSRGLRFLTDIFAIDKMRADLKFWP